MTSFISFKKKIYYLLFDQLITILEMNLYLPEVIHLNVNLFIREMYLFITEFKP